MASPVSSADFIAVIDRLLARDDEMSVEEIVHHQKVSRWLSSYGGEDEVVVRGVEMMLQQARELSADRRSAHRCLVILVAVKQILRSRGPDVELSAWGRSNLVLTLLEFAPELDEAHLALEPMTFADAVELIRGLGAILDRARREGAEGVLELRRASVRAASREGD